MRQQSKLLVSFDYCVVEPINILNQELLVSLEEEPNIVLELGNVALAASRNSSIYLLVYMLKLLRCIVLQEEADKAFVLILQAFSSHEGALLTILLSKIAFVAVLSCLDKLASVTVNWLEHLLLLMCLLS